MSRIKLLDCTLRDGGHINDGHFGKDIIKSIIRDLVKAKIDIIEAGFLWDNETDEDTARFDSIAKLKRYLPEDMGTSKISLMADNVDLKKLEPNDGTVDIIRLSFRKNEFDWAEKTIDILKDKGYKYYINTIHGSSFTDHEYLQIIERVNKLKPAGFSIVDTFGAMRQEDLGRIYYLVEKNLEENITLGIHLHENLGQAFSLAKYVLGIVAPTRQITIDGSLFGMGKVPGNLCIEQMMNYMNHRYKASYSIEPVYDAIDEFIMPIRQRVSWGYSIPYAISGQCGVHRTYAEYLCGKERLRTKDIHRLIKSIDKEHSEIFNREYIESIYLRYMGAEYDDKRSITALEDAIAPYQDIIIIAPGSSINDYNFNSNFVEDACSISVNFVNKTLKTKYAFFTNPKRLGFSTSLDGTNVIITSNLADEVAAADYIVSRNELAHHGTLYCDDSTLMLLNLMKRLGKRRIFLAGFDGLQKGKTNFYSQYLERSIHEDDADIKLRKRVLKESYDDMDITFLTPSLYKT